MRTYSHIRQTIVLDADDTLWHNNIFFERAIEDFIAFLNHSTMTRDEVRSVIDQIELANIRVRGYGSASFARNLGETFERLAERDIDDDQSAIVMGFGETILRNDIVLLDGVAETLESLAQRHDLVLFTKGNREEQTLKIDRSGLGSHFVHTEITPEKDRDAYLSLVSHLRSAHTETWMVGNSPRSDINPALAAGLNAVFIPHDNTWKLEHEELADGPGTLLILDRFSALLNYF